MRRWFAQPQLDGEYETFAAGVLHYTLLILTGILLLFSVFTTSIVQLVFIPAFLTLFVACYYLLHSGKIRSASLIFISCFWLIITFASFNSNGIRNPAIGGYTIVIIFTALFFPYRSVILLTGLSILSVIILTVGEIATVLPLNTTPLLTIGRFFQLIGLYSVTGVLLSSSSRVIQSNIERIRTHEGILLERNQALELEVTERRRVEADLRISEERYRLLFDNISAMAAVYGKDGEIIVLNAPAAKMFGVSIDTAQGRNMRDFLSEEHANSAIASQLEVIETGVSSLTERSVILEDGREVHFSRQIIPLPDPYSKKSSQVMVLTTDLTEKHMAQKRERELALAQEKNDFMGEFFSTLSHDLKTPLTVMKTSMYLLQRVDSEEKRQEKVTLIDRQITLLDKYIHDMLTISQLDYLPSLNRKVLDLNDLISPVVLSLQPQIENRKINLEFQPRQELVAIKGDDEQLQRLFINLIENAINYTPAGGRVRVKIVTVNDAIEVTITDSGIGIDADAIPHIFDRFYRTRKARNFHNNGTGLGLAIVKRIVDMHNATIDVKSQPTEGTTFTVRFPSSLSSSTSLSSDT